MTAPCVCARTSVCAAASEMISALWFPRQSGCNGRWCHGMNHKQWHMVGYNNMPYPHLSTAHTHRHTHTKATLPATWAWCSSIYTGRRIINRIRNVNPVLSLPGLYYYLQPFCSFTTSTHNNTWSLCTLQLRRTGYIFTTQSSGVWHPLLKQDASRKAFCVPLTCISLSFIICCTLSFYTGFISLCGHSSVHILDGNSFVSVSMSDHFNDVAFWSNKIFWGKTHVVWIFA